MDPIHITCNQCRGDAIPTNVDIVQDPARPSRIIDLILTIDCPKCGERKQPAPEEPGPH